MDKNQEMKAANEINVKEFLETINGIKDDIAELNNKLSVVIRDIDIINNTLQLLTNAPKEPEDFSNINNDNYQRGYYSTFSKYLFDIRSILDVIARSIAISNNKELKYSDYYTKNDDDDSELLSRMPGKKNISNKPDMFDHIIKNKFRY